jgi:hypothetical protein
MRGNEAARAEGGNEMNLKMSRPSSTFVVALAALFVALGGTALAEGVPFVAIGSSAGGDLAGAYPNPTIAPNAVESEEVLDASLRSDDIALFTGIITTDLGPIPPDGCPAIGRSIAGLRTTDFVVALPGDPFPFRFPAGLMVSGRIEASAPGGPNDLQIYVCNFSASEIDPPQTTFRFMIIR